MTRATSGGKSVDLLGLGRPPDPRTRRSSLCTTNFCTDSIQRLSIASSPSTEESLSTNLRRSKKMASIFSIPRTQAQQTTVLVPASVIPLNPFHHSSLPTSATTHPPPSRRASSLRRGTTRVPPP